MKEDLNVFKQKNICFYTIFLLIWIWQMFRLGENPGIYMDGIVSNYTVSYFVLTIVNPQLACN